MDSGYFFPQVNINNLKLSIVDGTHGRALRQYLKPDLLVVDDFGIGTMTREEAKDLYEIIIESVK